MRKTRKVPIFANGIKFYEDYQIITTAENVELLIGSCVRVILPNTTDITDAKPVTMKVKLKGKLKEQIRGMEFVISVLEHGSFFLGEDEMPSKFPNNESSKKLVNEIKNILPGYQRAQTVLESMNVDKDLDIQNCDEEDISNLNLLIATIGDKFRVKGSHVEPNQLSTMTIANIKLAVVYLNDSDGGYYILDYFGNHFDVSWEPDGAEPIGLSQFAVLTANDILMYDNLNVQVIVNDFKHVRPSQEHLEQGNQVMLELLKAYDQNTRPELLSAAKQLCDWIQDHPQYIMPEITTLNRMQITRRERELSITEKAELYKMMTIAPDDTIKVGALLLLNEQVEAKKILEALPQKARDKFKEFPIFKFYNPSEG